jgi:Fic family protein
MKTLQRFSGKPEAIPASTSWHIADLAEACGRQALYIRNSSSRLLAMEEHVLMESAVSSNRIEGRRSNPRCAGTMLSGKGLLYNRDEAVRNYRQALEWISRQEAELPLSLDTLLQLHALTCGEKAEARIPAGIEELITLWSNSLEERWVHPLLLLTAFNLDFLCLHPFGDGNGRVARLLLRLQSCRLGYDVGRYVSLERLIEQNGSQYCEALKESSRGWQDGSHNPWPYIDYLLFILKTAYRELESRLHVARSARGAKTGQIEAAVKSFPGPFSFSELEKNCPGTSHDMVRKVLRDLRDAGSVECLGRGPGAQWQRKDNVYSQKINTEARGKALERRNE